MLLVACGQAAPRATQTSSPTQGAPTSTSAAGESTTVSSPLRRALLSLAHYSRYAFRYSTWDMSGQTPTLLFVVNGIVVRPATYLNVTGPQLRSDVEIVYDDQGAYGRHTLAGVPQSDWTSVASLYSFTPGLEAAPLENPDPVEELIPDIATRATTAALPPPSGPAAAAPSDAAAAYEWVSYLRSGDTVVAQVEHRVWLNAAGVLIRWDRVFVPEHAASGTKPTYSSIEYSRQGDTTLALPASPSSP